MLRCYLVLLCTCYLAYSLRCPHRHTYRSRATVSGSSSHVNMADGPENLDDNLDLFSAVGDGQLDEQTKREIIEKLNDNMPSDLEIRMKIMGFNKFNLTGFAIAGVILLLNNILGNGWASDLLGWEQFGGWGTGVVLPYLYKYSVWLFHRDLVQILKSNYDDTSNDVVIYCTRSKAWILLLLVCSMLVWSESPMM